MIPYISLQEEKTADAYYRSHHEINTVIGNSLGGAVALSLEKQNKK